MSRCTIRKMKEADIDSLLEIERQSFPTPWNGRMFRDQLDMEDIAVNLSLVEENSVIGYLTAWFVFDEIHLMSIAVAPDRRCRGYANRMLNAVIDMGKERGMCRMVLEVRVGNTVAHQFYEKRGFRLIGKRKGYYRETGEDAFVMELDFDE